MAGSSSDIPVEVKVREAADRWKYDAAEGGKEEAMSESQKNPDEWTISIEQVATPLGDRFEWSAYRESDGAMLDPLDRPMPAMAMPKTAEDAAERARSDIDDFVRREKAKRIFAYTPDWGVTA
jgi:hypothetical protein